MYFHDAIEQALLIICQQPMRRRARSTSQDSGSGGNTKTTSSNSGSHKKRKRKGSTNAPVWQGRKILCTVGGYVVVPHAKPRGKFEAGRLIQVRRSLTLTVSNEVLTTAVATPVATTTETATESGREVAEKIKARQSGDFYDICVVMHVSDRGKTAQIAPLIGDGSEGMTIVHRSDDVSAWHLMPLSVGTAIDSSYDNSFQ